VLLRRKPTGSCSASCAVTQHAEENECSQHDRHDVPELDRCWRRRRSLRSKRLVRAMPISDEVIRFAVKLSRGLVRKTDRAVLREGLRTLGGESSGLQYLVLGAKALAAVNGRFCADYEGVQSVARQVLRHRILTNFNARAQKITVANIIENLLGEVTPDGR